MKPADLTLWVATITAVVLAVTKTGLLIYRLIQDARRTDTAEWHMLREQMKDGKPKRKRKTVSNPDDKEGDEDGHF